MTAETTVLYATIKPPSPPVVQINSDGGTLIVAIHPDGTVELGPGASNDEAAREFWDALMRVSRGAA